MGISFGVSDLLKSSEVQTFLLAMLAVGDGVIFHILWTMRGNHLKHIQDAIDKHVDGEKPLWEDLMKRLGRIEERLMGRR